MHNLRYSLALVLCFAFSANSQTSCELPDAACADCFSWCPGQKQFCEQQAVIRSLCKKTCESCVTNNPECRNLNCAQQCLLSDGNNPARCACDSGFRLESDGRTCTDINECEVNPSRCANVENATQCVNIVGSATCISCSAVDNTRIWSYYEKPECCLRNRQQSVCGKSSTNGRIVGGIDAPAQAWPWMAYIQVGENVCGGTLISRNHVLTAAHCVDNVVNNPGSVRIILGTSNIGTNTNVHTQTFTASRIVIHPKYKFPDYDAAVITLSSSVNQGQYVFPVCLAGGETPRNGEICYATGYGAGREGGVVSARLQQVDLPIVPISVCQQAYAGRTNDVDPSIHLCAGYAEGVKDACQGDSGGPLVCQRCANCDWYIAGIISFGRGCARPGFYGVFTDVTKVESWINGVIGVTNPHREPQCVKPSWTSWAAWSRCSVTCGSGTRQRRRACSQPSMLGNPGCLGGSVQTGDCNAPAVCSGAGWSSWTTGACSATCGRGTRQKTRTCVNGNIGSAGCPSGGETQSEACPVIDCPSWSNWQSWSSCSVTCGNGVRTAVRICNTFEAQQGSCSGSRTKTESCVRACWGLWSLWSACSATCGSGQQTSSRTCQFGEAGGMGCPDSSTRQRECTGSTCAFWTEWAGTDCSSTCGGGTRTRTRTCIGGTAGAAGCAGSSEITVQCNTDPCPAVAQWGTWGQYGACSVTCGSGTQTRIRVCVGGTVGTGNCIPITGETETSNCQRSVCVTGTTGWTNWSPTGICSATCGNGQRTETRQCNGGSPGSLSCLGASTRFAPCTIRACLPEWGPWGAYATCTVTCGSGTQRRTRTCIGGSVVGSSNCLGNAEEQRSCNTQACSAGGSSPCAGRINLAAQDTCCRFVSLNYCTVNFVAYMDANCNLACCRERERIPCTGGSAVAPPPCADTSQFCPFFATACSNFASVCPVTCNACPN